MKILVMKSSGEVELAVGLCTQFSKVLITTYVFQYEGGSTTAMRFDDATVIHLTAHSGRRLHANTVTDLIREMTEHGIKDKEQTILYRDGAVAFQA